MNGLALTYIASSKFESAVRLLKQALEIREKIFGPNHPLTATCLNNLASAYSALGFNTEARLLYDRSLKIREDVYGRFNMHTAVAISNIAAFHTDLKDFNRALPLHSEAASILTSILGSENPSTVKVLTFLAWDYANTGAPEAAVVLLKSTINFYQVQRQQISHVGIQELQSYTRTVSKNYAYFASLLADLGRLPEAQQVLDMLKEDEQFDFVRRSETTDPRTTRIGYTATEQKWLTRYNPIAGHLSKLGTEDQALEKQAKIGLTPEQTLRQKALAIDLAAAQKAFASFLGEMREGFTANGPARAVEVVETSQQALRETQSLLKGLGNNTVLLRYYVTDDKVGVLLTTIDAHLSRSSTVNVKDLNRQIAEFRGLLRDPKSNPLPVAQALYQLLIAPVAQDLDLAGAKTVMLSLDGALRYLPFGALHDGKQYVAQRWDLPIYTSVAKDKLRDAVTPQWQAAGLGVTRAVGEFAALPAVKGEMGSIVKAGTTGVLPGEVYLDEAFNANRLKDVGQRKFQLLHVASHFRFSPGTEVNSFLLLGDGQHLTLGDIRTQNYRFDNVDLLTLSACDTGLGGGRDGEGKEIEGFGVIAQQQGAKAVLATLWPVADRSTATLMAEMYRRRQEQNLTKIEALRQAQLSLLAQSKYAHPFYWAPFILMGNWK